MFSLELESDSETKDFLIAELWDRGSTGIAPSAACRLMRLMSLSSR